MKHFYLLVFIVAFSAALPANAETERSTPSQAAWRYVPEAEIPDPIKDCWWKAFDDSLLDSLISEALGANLDIKMADKRISISRMQMKQAQSALWPQLTASASWQKERSSAYTAARAGAAGEVDYFSLVGNVNWEIDVFGKVRSNIKASKAGINVSKADFAAVQLSICSQIVEEYITLRSAQAQLAVAQSLLEAQQKVLHIAEVRHNVSLASGLDVSQAKTVYLSTRSSIPALKTSVTQAANAIIVMLGEHGESWKERLFQPAPMPFCSLPFDKDISADMLRRRPDVAEAECEIAQYAALVGVAKKDFLPSLSLSASAGVQSHNLGDLFRKDAFTFSVSPTLSWAVFTGFSRKYALAEARERVENAIENYKLVLITASSEVDNAAVTYRNSVERTAMLSELLAEANKSLDFSIDLYKQGLSPFNNVMDAQIDVLNYSNNVITEKATAQLALVSLYKALGGGWTN